MKKEITFWKNSIEKSNAHTRIKHMHKWTFITEGNKEYMDLAWGNTAPLGALNARMAQAVHNGILNWTRTPSTRGLTCDMQIELSEALCGNDWAGFTWAVSGSDAVDQAVLISDEYWKSLGKVKPTIISVSNSYHGNTYLARSMSGMSLPLGRMSRTRVLKPIQKNNDIEEEKKLLFRLEREFKSGGVGCFIIEPVLINAGVISLSNFCWTHIRKLCDNYHVILITDDISSGCGKLGSWHSIHTAQHGIQSDINILGKALTGGYAPLAMTFSKDFIWERVATKMMFGNTHYPFMGGVAAALEYREIVKEQFLFYKAINTKKQMVSHMLPEKTNSIGLMHHIYFDKPKDYRDILNCGIFHPPRKDKVDGIRFVIPVGADSEYWEKLLPRLEKLCGT